MTKRTFCQVAQGILIRVISQTTSTDGAMPTSATVAFTFVASFSCKSSKKRDAFNTHYRNATVQHTYLYVSKRLPTVLGGKIFQTWRTLVFVRSQDTGVVHTFIMEGTVPPCFHPFTNWDDTNFGKSKKAKLWRIEGVGMTDLDRMHCRYGWPQG